MISEILSLITSLIVGIALMAHWGFLRRLLPPFLSQRILDELSRLKSSTPNSTLASNSNTLASL